jgi:hypothetical protein
MVLAQSTFLERFLIVTDFGEELGNGIFAPV